MIHVQNHILFERTTYSRLEYMQILKNKHLQLKKICTDVMGILNDTEMKPNIRGFATVLKISE